MKHSAEWYRGAVAVLGRMVDECQTVFESDLPHITQGNLEDYLAEYAELLAAAEAREAGEHSAAEVIRVAKAALEGCRGNVANHSDGHHKQFIRSEEMAEKALAAIAAWEAGNGKP